VSTNESTQARRERERLTDATLAEDRAGRDRLRRRADTQVPPSHEEPRGRPTPGTNLEARP
jgi:hypothetical protein